MLSRQALARFFNPSDSPRSSSVKNTSNRMNLHSLPCFAYVHATHHPKQNHSNTLRSKVLSLGSRWVLTTDAEQWLYPVRTVGSHFV